MSPVDPKSSASHGLLVSFNEMQAAIEVERQKKELKIGWLGLEPMTIEVDYQLVLQLGGAHVVKVMVVPNSPAWRAGIRSGDYLQSASPSPTQDMAFDEFKAMHMPVGTTVYLKVHRRKTRMSMTVPVILRAQPTDKNLPKWKRFPRIEPGRYVEKSERHVFEAKMRTHPSVSPLGFRLLMHIMRKYDGPNGAFPSHSRLAREMGKSERWIITQLQRLKWVGVLRIEKHGAPTGGLRNRRSNLFVPCWPDQGASTVVGFRHATKRAVATFAYESR